MSIGLYSTVYFIYTGTTHSRFQQTCTQQISLSAMHQHYERVGYNEIHCGHDYFPAIYRNRTVFERYQERGELPFDFETALKVI